MKHYASIDFGFDSIKVLYGRWANGTIVGETFIRELPLESRNELSLKSQDDYEKFFDEHHNAYFDALESLLERFHQDTSYYISFSSMFGDIYTKQLHTNKKKKMKIAANLLSEKLQTPGNCVDFDIVKFDKETQTGEVLVYSYKEEVFRHFLELLENLAVNPTVVEFDSLSLANCAATFQFEPSTLFIDFGFAKTNIVKFEEEELKEIVTLKYGFHEILQRVSKRTNLSIREVSKMLKNNEEKLLNKIDIEINELIKPLLLKLKNDVCDSIDCVPPIIYVTGGCLTIPNFVETMNEVFSENVTAFQPLEKYTGIINVGMHPGLFTITLGLFLRSL